MFAIPTRYKTAAITAEMTPEWTPVNHQVAYEFLRSFGQYATQGKAPLFAGNPGTGKSYSAAAILNRVITARRDLGLPELQTAWVPVGEALDRILYFRDHRLTEQFREADSLLINSPLLVFDDFGHLRNYERLRELFWIYVNARYDRMLPTIFTANLDMSDGWDALDRDFGEAFRRRIQAMSEGLTAVV